MEELTIADAKRVANERAEYLETLKPGTPEHKKAFERYMDAHRAITDAMVRRNKGPTLGPVIKKKFGPLKPRQHARK